MEKTREKRIEHYIESEKKSVGGAFVLALLFGPVGYLYASPMAETILILIAVGVALVAWPLAIFVWLFCVIAAPFEAISSNKKLRAKAELMAG